jgi:hypothetical protein
VCSDLVEELACCFRTAGSDQPVNGLQPFQALVAAVATSTFGCHTFIVRPPPNKNKTPRAYFGSVRDDAGAPVRQAKL